MCVLNEISGTVISVLVILSRDCSDYRLGTDWQSDLLNNLAHNF
jgi:hypothetical protein